MTDNSSFTIVVGFDGSKDSQSALSWAVEEARQRNGQLRLVTVWNRPSLAWFPDMLETAAGEIAGEGDSPQKIAGVLQAKALKFSADEGVAASGEIVHSKSPASAILHAAQEADLIIVGSRGHGGFLGLQLGSVSTQIINHAPCPVLVVRPKAS